MQITAFNPLILTTAPDEAIATLDALGFARAHQKDNINGHVTSVDLKYGEQFRADVAGVTSFERDMVAIRMNVRDFQEAYDFLISRGFINTQGDKVTETSSSTDTLLISPSGFGIVLSEHRRA